MEIQKRDHLDSSEWRDILKNFPEHRIYHTPEWFGVLMNTQRARLRVYLFINNNQIIGFLPGLIIKKRPFRIFASPFEGWYTPYIGLLLKNNEDIYECLVLLKKQLRKDYIHYAQMTPVFPFDIDRIKKMWL